MSIAQTPWVLPGNNSINPNTDYLGTQNNADLVLRTNATERFRLLPDAAYTIGSFSSQTKDGSMLLCPKVSNFYGNGAPGPFSLLHLAALDDNAQEISYRDWMKTGITFTGNDDHAYIGQKIQEIDHEEQLDYTDMVIHWSDNPGEFLKDRLRFIFTSGYSSSATSGAQSHEGLEFMRMYPDRYEDPHIGIGDWYAANLANSSITEPEERLDIVNGKVRIRDLPTDPTSTSDELVTVNMTTGNLEHRPANALPDNCEWLMHSSSPNHVYTAYGSPDDACPDEAEFVGIGINYPLYKLDILHSEAVSTPSGGLHVDYFGSNDGVKHGAFIQLRPENGTDMEYAVGLESSVENPYEQGHGVQGIVTIDNPEADYEDSQATGVYGVVNAYDGHFDRTFGTRGQVSLYDDTPVNEAYGSYGLVYGQGDIQWSHGMYGEARADGTVPYNVGGFALAQWENGATVTESIGLDAQSSARATETQALTSWGVRAMGYDGEETTFGVQAAANGTGAICYGVHGVASGGSAGNYSVYGYNSGLGPTGDDWAGYFDGDVNINGEAYCTSMTWGSDASLKTDIEDITGATELLSQVQPHSYRFLSEVYPARHLPQGPQLGVIAQELEVVLPQLVQDVHWSAVRDTAGLVVAPEMTIKSVNYVGLIPVLIAAFQEQNERIAFMEEALASCCNTVIQRAASGTTGSLVELETDLRIIPNPIADRTELRYMVGTEGRVRLEITDASGRTIQVQEEGARTTGTFSYAWDTTRLAPGTYFCTLYVNDEPLVKKAVKLNER